MKEWLTLAGQVLLAALIVAVAIGVGFVLTLFSSVITFLAIGLCALGGLVLLAREWRDHLTRK